MLDKVSLGKVTATPEAAATPTAKISATPEATATGPNALGCASGNPRFLGCTISNGNSYTAG